MAKISTTDRHRIIIYYQVGLSQREMTKKCKISRTAIQNTIKKFNETGCVEDKKQCGWPNKIKESHEKFLRLQSDKIFSKTDRRYATSYGSID
ncbi:hypothetical protein WH47_04248 [Habropoda laboriosa]|uniref:Histone-lysine N-methyltransferase SETMAR n=1 Tax=Habropoda laboriosa TaxID=597456 RepID=A0A0L7QVB6_9HYME|nr:hypothetical protein WH47_04248 [Habropoda laboriosa]